MEPKLDAALKDLERRTPDLWAAIRGLRFVETRDSFSAFAIDKEGVLFYNPVMLEDTSNEEAAFGLGVSAFLVANDVSVRGHGRDPLLWGMAANLIAQIHVEERLGCNGKSKGFVTQFERRFPGVKWQGLSLESLYNALLQRDGDGSKTRAMLN